MSADSKKNNLPFDPDTSKKVNRNSDGTTQSPMSRARALAKMARDRANTKEDVSEISQDLKNRYKDKAKSDYDHQKFSADIAKDMNAPDAEKHYRRKQMNRAKGIERASEAVEENFNWKVSHAGKNVHVKAPNAGTAVKKAQRGFGNMDLTKAKITNLGKVGTPTNEDNQIDELSNDTLRSYHAKAATDLKKKKDQVAKGQLTQKDFKKGQNRVTGLNRAANKMEATVDTANIASKKAMKKSDTEKLGKLADMLAKEKKPKTEAKLDELSPATHKSYQAKAFSNAALGMAKKSLGKMSAKDAYDNEVKRHKGIDTSKYLNRKQHGIKDSVEEAKDMYKSAATELKNYAKKSGGIDAPTFHAAAKHIENIGRSNVMQKGQHLGILSKHLRDMDTSPREKVLSVLHKHGHDVSNFGGYKMRRESVDEAGTPERLAIIRKAGEKINKEKKKAERDAKKAMSKDKDMMGEATYGTQTQRLMSPLQKARQDKEKADRDRDGKLKKEETVSELKKSTLGSYVNKAAKDAASKAYGAASAAKDNNTEKGGKDFSKSLKRLRGINTATKKLAKEDTNEAKSFDQKFKDHLKFATSKSPAVQAHLKKRAADRDAMNKKNDPNAAKKGYALSAVPPERAYHKARKKGMDPYNAKRAATAANRSLGGTKYRGRKLPEKFANPAQQAAVMAKLKKDGKYKAESTQFQVDVDGLPPTFMQGRSSAEILAKLRKIVKQPSMIKSVERKTDTDVRKVYRAKAQNREED